MAGGKLQHTPYLNAMSWGSWLIRNGVAVESFTTYEQFEGLAKFLGIVTKNRKREIVLLRYCFWEYVRENTSYSLSRIGSLTGGHDHAAVLHGINELRAKALIKDSLVKIAKTDFKILKARYEKGNSIQEK